MVAFNQLPNVCYVDNNMAQFLGHKEMYDQLKAVYLELGKVNMSSTKGSNAVALFHLRRKTPRL